MKRYLLLLSVCFFLSAEIASAQSIGIIPYPTQATLGEGSFKLSSSTKIFFDKKCQKEGVFLRQILKEQQLSPRLIAKTGKKKVDNGIYLTLSPPDSAETGKEGYSLQVDPHNIMVRAATTTGIFYGIQSLHQIINNKAIPCMTIKDSPRFSWRAFMLDEGRYFKGEKVVKDLLDEMALLKMNVFHWHLTDDQGWRIEIKKYPKLTEVGSTREQSETGTWLSNKFDGKKHSGFYTQEQIKDIVLYAADRHISIVPEIEMPGHASAAIASYPWLGAENKPIEVPIRFGIQLNVYNVVNPKVQQFLHDVLDEVMSLFPSGIVHIGGDEVKYDQWKASDEVQQYMKQHNISTPADLQIDFTNSISYFLEQHGHRMVGWNDILGGHNVNDDSVDAQIKQQLSKNTIIEFWSGDPNIVTKAALMGHDVVNAYWVYTYLDYDYNTTSLSKAYSFDPIPPSLPDSLRKRVLGLGCQMWGEWIPTVEQMNYHIYPRIAAIAEVGWSGTENRDFKRFRQALNGYLKGHWQSRGITLLPEQLQ